MTGFILNKPDFCPQCGQRSVSRSGRCCEKCRVRLFLTTDNFAALDRDFVKSFWVYFPERTAQGYAGWVYASHLLSPDPISPDYKIPGLPPPGYGKHKLPAGCSDQ